MIFITIILTLFFIIRICSSAILIILGILLSKEMIKDYLEITMGEKITIYSVVRAIIYILLVTTVWLFVTLIVYALIMFI